MHEINFEEIRKRNLDYLKKLKKEAISNGVEEYSVDKAIKYYYPSWANDIEDAKKRLQNLESDYYRSGYKTLKKWGQSMENYEVYKDSTGHD